MLAKPARFMKFVRLGVRGSLDQTQSISQSSNRGVAFGDAGRNAMPAARTSVIRDELQATELSGRVRGFERQTGALSAHRTATRAVHGDIEVDVPTRRLWRSGNEIKLPKRGFSILLCLMGKPRHVFSRAQLRDFVWGRSADIDERTVDVQIGRLRKALGSAGHPGSIRTARGAGYYLAVGPSGSAKHAAR
jgi:DNA-binding winged helix-turn-helix (wHTH) protein